MSETGGTIRKEETDELSRSPGQNAGGKKRRRLVDSGGEKRPKA